MTNFKLRKDEELLKIFENIEVKANDNKFILTLFLTSQRLILLNDINKELDYNVFLATRLVDIPQNLEVVFDLLIKDIKKIDYKNNINEIIFKGNTNVLKLYCENINLYLNKN